MLPAGVLVVILVLVSGLVVADQINVFPRLKMRTSNTNRSGEVLHSSNFSLMTIMRDMLDINAPTTSHNNTQCRVDSEIYRKEALATSPWALRMYDSSTKLPDGLLVGNLIQMGNFDECLAVRYVGNTESHGPILGQYCLAGVTLSGKNQTTPSLTNTFKDNLVNSLIGRRLLWSVCIPSSCHAEDLQAHLQMRMVQLLLNNDTSSSNLQVTVFPGNCYTAKGERLSKTDWCFIMLLVVFLVVVVMSTVYDTAIAHVTSQGKKDTVWVAFSLYKNSKALFSTSRRGQMASLHGIKFLSMVWVMLFHKYSVMVETPNVNSDTVLEGLKHDWTQMPISNGGSLSVNTFFVVSGLLLIYVFFRDRDAGRPFNVISFYVYRYIRLTPIYAIVIGLYATVAYHLGNGPLWNATMAMHRTSCRKHWWRNLLYINNYQPITSELCVVQSWYLAADTQLYWLSPLLLYPLWKWPKMGRLMLGLLFIIPVAIPAWLTYTKSFPWADVKDMNDEIRNQYFPKVYAATYSRAAPFLVGVLVGYLLYNTRKKKIILSKWLVLLGWLISTAISLTIVYALNIYYKQDHKYSKLEAAAFSGLHPIGWGIVIAWIIFACEKGYAGPVSTFLSWKWFQPLSKLSYSAYLVHFMVFYHDLAITRTPSYYHHYSVVHYVLGDMVIILLLSALFALTFEIPVLNLDKLFLKPDSKKSPAAPNNHTQESKPQIPTLTLSVPGKENSTSSIEDNTCGGNSSPRGHINFSFDNDQNVSRLETEDVKVNVNET